MKRAVLLIVVGLVVVVAVTVAATLTLADDGGAEGAGSAKALSRAEWEDAVVDAGGRRDSDFDTLEDLAKDGCERDEDSWAMYLSLRGAEPEIARLGLQHVCPDQVEVFDAGQAQLEQSVGRVELACDTPPGDRTDEQRNLAEAMGC